MRKHSGAAVRDVAAIWLSCRPGRAGTARALALEPAGSPLALPAGGPALPGTGQALPAGATTS